jgi:nucleotide-binding universal stress UspA family protein
VIHAWELDGESLLRHGRGRVSSLELDLLLKATETRHREGLDALLQPYGLDTQDERVHLIKGRASEIITRHAQHPDIDLIVMGTLGRAGIAGLFIGNTAENVLRSTRTAVLTVKPDGFASPVQ